MTTCQRKSLKHQKPLNTMTSVSLISENGREKVPSQLNKLQEDITTTSSLSDLNSMKMNQSMENGHRMSSIQESLLENKKTTSNDKLNTCPTYIQTSQSSEMSEVESTTREKDSKPYWNDFSEEISRKLWLPIKTDLSASGSTSLNGCSHNSVPYWKLWNAKTPIQKTTLLGTSWKSLQSSHPDTMVAENMNINLKKKSNKKKQLPEKQKENQEDQKKKEKIRVITRKFRFYPTTIQKTLFRKCFGAHRFFYNRTVSVINEKYDKRKEEFENSKSCVHCDQPKVENSFTCDSHKDKPLPWNLNITHISIRRSAMKTDKDVKGTSDDWQIDIPYDTRDLSIKDAVTAYKSGITNKCRGNIKQFKLNYMSRKKPSHIFWITKDAIKIENGKVSLFSTRLKKDKFLRFRSKQRKLLPPSIDHQCKIMYDRGAYYLILTLDEKEKPYSPAPNEITSMDPGVRTFQTGYSPDGLVFKSGEEHIRHLRKLYDRIDHLRSLRSKSKYRKKWRLKQRLSKLELKFYNISQNFHNQLASLLVNQFETILLPEFRTSEMLTGDKISSKTKREMQGLSHYRFQQKLQGLCERDKRKLVIVTEEYTTKTCGCCGHIWNNVGGSKIYKCQNEKCNYELDRDVHGARNILIKYYSQFGSMMHDPI